MIGRIDDVVNVSGHRLSTAEVESAIVAHPDVAEAAVIGQHDEDTGQAIVAFVTLQGDLQGDEPRSRASATTVAERIGKFARPKRIIWSDDLPKTRSGKIMRRLLRDIAEGRALGDVTTLRDPDGDRAAAGAREGAAGPGRLSVVKRSFLAGSGKPDVVLVPRQTRGSSPSDALPTASCSVGMIEDQRALAGYSRGTARRRPNSVRLTCSGSGPRKVKNTPR